MKLKILMVMERHAEGGAEVAFMQQSALLAAMGHQVVHFTLAESSGQGCPYPHEQVFPSQVTAFSKPSSVAACLMQSRVIRLGNRLARFLYIGRMVRRLRGAIASIQPDIVHFHSVREFLHPKLFAVPGGIDVPSVLTVHDPWIVCPSRLLLKGMTTLCEALCALEAHPGQSCQIHHCIPSPIGQVLNRRDFHSMMQSGALSQGIDLILSPSQALAEMMRKSPYLDKQRICVHYNAPNQNLAELTLEFTPEKTYFLALGNITDFKGFPQLVEAFSRLPEIPLVIAGNGSHRSILADKVRLAGLQHIRFVDWQSGDTLWKLYQGAYAVVVPSVYFENAPMIIQESYAHGKPVIGTRVGGIPEFIQHEESGLLVEPGNIAELIEAVKRLWENPALVAQMGQAGHRLFHDNFSLAQHYQQLMKWYEVAHEIRLEKKQISRACKSG